MAIKEAFLIFASSVWVGSYGLIIERDSLNAVRWFNCVDQIPWRLKKFCPEIERLKRVIKDWKEQHVLKESNETADILAKAGVFRSDNFLLFLSRLCCLLISFALVDSGFVYPLFSFKKFLLCQKKKKKKIFKVRHKNSRRYGEVMIYIVIETE
ncbi:hypothetical protein REPUB_Repub10bG0029500 [Reevesia pubescens]